MTNRRDERDHERRETKDAEEADEIRQEEGDRRSDDLQEAWRRHHLNEQEEGGKGRPKNRHPP